MEIVIKQMSKEFSGKTVFSNLNWQIKNNSMVAIKGNSGSGKTTLLNIISLIDKPSSGELLFDTESVGNIDSKKRRKYLKNDLGFIFQNYGLLENSTLKQNLDLALKSKKIGRKEKKILMTEALKRVDLLKLDLKTKVSTLSGGEQQRIGIARCILKNGNLVIADEPTAALDSQNEEMVMLQLKELKKRGHTIVLTTHSQKYDDWFDDIFYL